MTDLHKPVKRIARGVAPHGFTPDVVVTLYPNGHIGLREARRRKEYLIPIAAVLTMAVKRDVAEARRARKGR